MLFCKCIFQNKLLCVFRCVKKNLYLSFGGFNLSA